MIIATINGRNSKAYCPITHHNRPTFEYSSGISIPRHYHLYLLLFYSKAIESSFLDINNHQSYRQFHLFSINLVKIPSIRFIQQEFRSSQAAMAEELSPEQEKLIKKLKIFKIKGRDKRGRKILRIIGKYFPARDLSLDVLNLYLEKKIFPKLERPFAVVYIHTEVCKGENFPGISFLRSVYDSIPITVKQNLETVYFVHPDLQSRLFLATFGRFIFTGGLYGKLRYVSRLDYLWEHVRRNEMEIPEFVRDHDEDLEYRPMMDYGVESDHPRVYGEPAVDSSVAMYSTRCIS